MAGLETPNLVISHLVLLIVFISSSVIISANHPCNKMDQDSLFSSFDIPSSPLNWSSNIDCCQWEGITCDTEGRVTHLLLPSKGLKLKGAIFPSLGNLTHLTLLNLSHNSLYGSLEAGFFLSLNRLEILDLSYNYLSGELPFSPPSIGSLPSSICHHSCPLIRLFDFSFNNFSGSISHGLGECSKLQVFRAGYNNLSGLLPDDIYNASTLEEIALPRNSLHGAISHKIVNLTKLTILNLDSNQMSGMLPISIGKLSKLKLMLLYFNNLEGSLPQSLMNCTNLVELRLGFNNFEGNISTLNFSKLSQLTKLDLINNQFTGIFPISLYSCKSLKAIRLAKNHVEGQIQPEILSLKSLSFLTLSRLTNITGAIKILTRCKSLRVLFLPLSFLGEKMPTTEDIGMVDFDGFQNLQVLGLSYCDLTGQIPVWLSKLKKLEILNLYSNRLTGPIPSWLGDLPKLFHIRLTHNLLSGELPKELGRLPMLISEETAPDQVEHDVLELPLFSSQIKFPAFFNRQYQSLQSFPRAMLIKNNNINGSIPIEIGQLQLLQMIDLSGNNISGNIPDQISNLKKLEYVDLSMNHLSGDIPVALRSLSYLSYFNVSYNNLQGPIPTSTQFQSFNASQFEGNPKLCGAPLPNECRATNDDDSSSQDVKNENEIPWFRISVALGFITGFWGVCGPLVLKRTWRYAYFQFLSNVHDKIYVMIAVRMARMQRSLGF